MAKKGKGKKVMFARRKMIAFLRQRTGLAFWNGKAPSNAELFSRCEDHLGLSSFEELTKMQRLDRIMEALGEKYPEIKATPPKKHKAAQRKNSRAFYDSDRWKELRYRVLKLNDGRCECCGRGKEQGVILHVDHIKPRSRYPHLEWNITNLQVLCEDCNLGKRAWDETDWREPRLVALMGERVDGLDH